MLMCAAVSVLPSRADSFGLTNFNKRVTDFVAEKQAQSETYGDGSETPAKKRVAAFFKAAKAADWGRATNLFQPIQRDRHESRVATKQLPPEVWMAVHETLGYGEQHLDLKPKYIALFAEEVFRAVPEGAIYFGGTDAGRFVITALSESHNDGRPFYTLTQNALADGTHLAALQTIFGSRINLPTASDSQRAFQTYMTDAQTRLQHDKDFPDKPRRVLPGEDVRTVNSQGQAQVQVSGVVAVMAINGLLVKDIFEQNTNREFYIEESYPIDWMYPLLVPAGPVMKLQRPQSPGVTNGLTGEQIAADRKYWTQLTGKLIGPVVTEKTGIEELCAFVEAVHLRKERAAFKGDSGFLENTAAQKLFSKLRGAIAGIYLWRSTHDSDASTRKQMQAEAEFAFKQAWVLCPVSPEALFRYANFLESDGRVKEAIRLVRLARKLDPENAAMQTLMIQLLDSKKKPAVPRQEQ